MAINAKQRSPSVQTHRELAREIAISSHAPLWWDSIRLSLGVGFMPLYWTINFKERLFTGSGEGGVTFADATALLECTSGRAGAVLPKAVRWP